MSTLAAIMLIMAMSVLCAPNATASEAPRRVDISAVTKNRIERERQFLLRAVDDLNRSQGYVQSMVGALEKLIEAVDILEPSSRERDIGSFLEWYRSYAEWLGGMALDLERDLSRAYTDDPTTIVTPDYYDPLLIGYQRLGSQLEQHMAQIDKISDRTLQRMAVLRSTLDYLTTDAFIEERKKDKKRDQRDGHDRRRDERFERYKDITDAEIAMMQLELKNLDDLQKHFVVLREMGRMELFWISRKTGDYETLNQLAKVIGGAGRALEDASDRMIKLYDSDIAYFKGRIHDVDGRRGRIVPSGSLRTLDRAEELSQNYDRMRSRFEHHMVWLAEQVGAYRADIVILRNAR